LNSGHIPNDNDPIKRNISSSIHVLVTTFVGVSDSAVILSPLVEANVAHDSELLFANHMEASANDMCAVNDGVCRSVIDHEQ
jgi:hypothetical protein